MPATASDRRVPEIDGLRGVAILLVMFVHFYVQQFPDAFRGVSPDFFEFCLSGAAGVDLFFVISGFLIGGILLSRITSGRALKAFYLRRAWRIWPLYYLIVAVAFLSSLGGYDVSFRVPWISYLFFTQNISLSLGLISVPMLGPLWSLAIEEHFYLFAPLAARWLRPRNFLLLAIAMIILSPALRMLAASLAFKYRHVFAFNFTLCRLDSIGFGLLGAVLWKNSGFRALVIRHQARLLGLACLLGFFAILASIPAVSRLSPTINLWRITLNAAFFLSLIFASISERDSLLSRCLRVVPLRFTGVRCYFLYVFHMAILSIAQTFLADTQLATLVALLLCVVYAQISWRFIERPLIQYSHRWKYDPELD